MKKLLVGLLLVGCSFTALANPMIKSCSDLADTVKIVAENRDAGLSAPTALGVLIGVGINPGAAGQLVEWVYNKEPEITPRAFYKDIMRECRRQAERTRK